MFMAWTFWGFDGQLGFWGWFKWTGPKRAFRTQMYRIMLAQALASWSRPKSGDLPQSLEGGDQRRPSGRPQLTHNLTISFFFG